MTFLAVYLLLIPFLCFIGMTLIEKAEAKIKTALARKAKAVNRHSCKVEEITYADNNTRRAV